MGLDPPRHLFIHTVRSLTLLAEHAGLTPVRRYRDSWGLQFWGSEQYRDDIPLRDPRSHAEGGSAFTAEQIQAFETRALRLNAEGDGDAGCFVFRRP